MFKKILLILALMCMIVLPVFSQTGSYTTNRYFYLPEYGAYGTDEYNEYNLYMQKADTQIEANKDAIAGIDTSSYYLKTEINTQAKVEAIWGVSLVNDGDLIDVAAGGTEKSSWTLYAIPYLSGTTAFGEIAIGTAEYALTVNAGATGYDWTLFDLSLYYLKTEIDTQGELETIWGDTLMNDLVDDPAPELGGEMDAGAHSIGFTLQTTTGDGTTTIDWRLGNKFEFTFGAQNDTFTFTAPTNVQNMMMWIIQDATGSRTITWPNTVRWPGGTAPTLTTTANAVDIVSFAWNGTNYDGVTSLAFAAP